MSDESLIAISDSGAVHHDGSMERVCRSRGAVTRVRRAAGAARACTPRHARDVSVTLLCRLHRKSWNISRQPTRGLSQNAQLSATHLKTIPSSNSVVSYTFSKTQFQKKHTRLLEQTNAQYSYAKHLNAYRNKTIVIYRVKLPKRWANEKSIQFLINSIQTQEQTAILNNNALNLLSK